MAKSATEKIDSLSELVPILRQAPGFADVVRALQQGRRASISGAWGSSCALAAVSLFEQLNETMLVVLPRIADVDDFALDVSSFLGSQPLIFSAWETLPDEHNVADAIFGGRLRLLGQLDQLSEPALVVTSLPALLQPVPSKQKRQQSQRPLKVGDEIELDEFMRWLVECGFERVTAIEVPGEFCLHGGILDLYPPDMLYPLRIELFGDEIESIRSFDVETQRKIEELTETQLTLLTPVMLSDEEGDNDGSTPTTAALDDDGECLLDSLPAESVIVLSELMDLVSEGKNYFDRIGDKRGLYTVDSVLAQCEKFPIAGLSAILTDKGDANCSLQISSVERLVGPKTKILPELVEVIDEGEKVLIVCHNEGEQQRLSELFAEQSVDLEEPAPPILLCVGNMTTGFRLMGERLVVISDHELLGRTDIRRHATRGRKRESRAIDNFLELHEGDLVVHLSHGIGRYRGIQKLESDKQIEEHLTIEFRDGIRVYVPVSLIHLVQKYVGSAQSVPRLSKLGGTSWDKKKQRVASAIKDMASELIRLQAAREAMPGIAFPPDSHWQQEFEAAFPYVETDDQLMSIDEVKSDMQRQRPMDRLICGDVGYGKTEVAMRGAFKAVDSGKQAAILVPTTVLAEQHFRTFRERMAEYPIAIEVLSRFRTKGQQKVILQGLAEGTVDIVIGTHRLVQKDVKFKNLGLLVIDEEQRFGVDAKETLKRMRLEVDVLTLSATPIPRTLHMSILGIRDISNLLTAPQERVAVQTQLCRFDRDLIRHAIVRELNRNGQVYFVHNRVYNIQEIAETVHSIVPEARVGIGHGQMAEKELEQAMFEFVSGETDVFVCTTIIESGLDIPNANTILINQANNFGLADLHQLRGRVGRYKHRAYCYLIVDDSKPLTSTSRKRLKAIEEFSELGAGFRIALRDLEIRGAGNILGGEQSGHISSVGYELYCQLLENAVRRMKNEKPRPIKHVKIDLPVAAYLPEGYVPAGKQKLEIYRKVSNCQSDVDLKELKDEIRDRFGPLPGNVERLAGLRSLQLDAWNWGIREIRLEDDFAVFEYQNSDAIRQLAQKYPGKLRIVDHKSAYWVLENADELLLEDDDGDALLAHLKLVLQQS